MTIIITRDGKDPIKLEKSGFENEDRLQQYIYTVPESIPLYDIKQDIKLLVAAREFPTSSGPIDAVGIDQDGEIYLIETKLYKNPDKRLVVAQVLDYGASLWNGYRDFDNFRTTLEGLSRKNFENFYEKLREFFGLEEDELESLINNMKKNLSSGNYKFVILMDDLYDRLKDLIVFINQNSQFDVYAVELEHYKHQDFELTIPKLFGAQIKKMVGVTRSEGERKQWNESSFFEDAKSKLNEEQYKAVQKLFEFSKDVSSNNIRWGTGSQNGSFGVIFEKIRDRSLYSVFSDGLISLHFRWLNENEKTERYRDEFKDKLSKILGITIPPDYKEITHFRLPIEQWYEVREKFMNAVQDLIS